MLRASNLSWSQFKRVALLTRNRFRNLKVRLIAPGKTASARRPGTNAVIAWTTIFGKRYQVQWRDSLSTGTWGVLQNSVAGTGAVLIATDNAAAQRFYRVVTLP